MAREKVLDRTKCKVVISQDEVALFVPYREALYFYIYEFLESYLNPKAVQINLLGLFPFKNRLFCIFGDMIFINRYLIRYLKTVSVAVLVNGLFLYWNSSDQSQQMMQTNVIVVLVVKSQTCISLFYDQGL